MTNRISEGQGQTPPFGHQLSEYWLQTNYQCDGDLDNPDGIHGKPDARGVTYWRGDTNQYTLSPNNQQGNNPNSQIRLD